MKVFKIFPKNLYISRVFKTAKILISFLFVFFFYFSPAVGKPLKSKESVENERKSIRYGVDVKQFIGGNYTGFIQYDFSKYFGWRFGIGYSYDYLLEIDSNIKDPFERVLKGKFIWYRFAPIQNSARIYPFVEDLCIAIGIEIGVFPMQVKSEGFVKDDENKINSETKNDKNELYLCSTQVRWFSGVDYTTSFGLLFGINFMGEVTSFINPNKNRDIANVGGVRLFLGIDASKWFS